MHAFSNRKNAENVFDSDKLMDRKMPETKVKRMNLLLWITQALLALVFLFSGGSKLVLPIAAMTKQMPMPGWFLRFLGAAEILGALGLILPGITRIQTILTPLAATGLVILKIGATTSTAAQGMLAGHRPPVPGTRFDAPGCPCFEARSVIFQGAAAMHGRLNSCVSFRSDVLFAGESIFLEI